MSAPPQKERKKTKKFEQKEKYLRQNDRQKMFFLYSLPNKQTRTRKLNKWYQTKNK